MSTAGSAGLPLTQFAGLVTDIPASDLPPGASPYNRECAPSLGAVKTRPGLGTGVFDALAGSPTPTVNYERTFTDKQAQSRLLFLDSLGRLWQEFPQGTIAQINSAGQGVRDAWGKSTTLYGREYIAFSDGKVGSDIPRQWDGVYYDRVSQEGPGAGPSVSDFLPAAVVLDSPGPSSTLTIATAETTDQLPFVWQDWQEIPNPYGERGTIWTWVDVTTDYYTRATIETTTPHGFSVGQVVTIAGSAAPIANGTFTITEVPTATSFKFEILTVNFQSGAGGTANSSSGGVDPTLVRQNNTVTANATTTHNYLAGFLVQISSIANSTIGGGLTSIARVNGIVTGNTTTPHGLPVGAKIAIVGVAVDTTFNGEFIVTGVPGPNSFTYAQDLSDSNTGTGGNVQDVWNGTFTIASVPTPTTFTYRQIGPNNQTADAGAAAAVGTVEAGQHQVAVAFKTRNGYITRPSVPVNFIAGGGKLLSVTNIPIGPPNVVSRILMFTPRIPESGGGVTAPTGSFYTTGARMEVANNTDTNLVVNFSDTELLQGILMDRLFRLVSLAACAGVTSYQQRLAWWGERNKLQNIFNMAFDGGFTGNVPLGWNVNDLTAGGEQVGGTKTTTAVFGDAYQILGDGATAVRGKIVQQVSLDFLGLPIIAVDTPYSVRVRVQGVNYAASAGRLNIRLYSPSTGLTAAGLQVLLTALTAEFAEYTAELLTAQASIPSDLELQIFIDQTPANGSGAIVDEVEVFPTRQPYNNTLMRVSFAEQPEAYDGITGKIQPTPQDGQSIRAAYKLRRALYILKERSWHQTTDDQQSEPAGWPVDQVSEVIGTLSVQGVSEGDEYVVVMDRNGAYIHYGGQPQKISQEIQPTWDETRWTYGHRGWVLLDPKNKRVYIGQPTGEATAPNRVLMMDFRGLDFAEQIAAAFPISEDGVPRRARTWWPWTMQINSAAIVERTSDSTQKIFMGNGAATGKIYDLSEANRTDDGDAIPWDYRTYYAPSPGQEAGLRLGTHRKSFDYLSGLVKGSGTMGIRAQQGMNLKPLVLPSVNLVDPDVTKAVTTAIRYLGILTVTCAAGHGLTAGVDDLATVDGTADDTVNDTFPVLEVLNATQFTIYQPDLPDVSLGAAGVVTRVLRDFEMMVEFNTERASFRFFNEGNVEGSWMELQKFAMNLSEDAWAPVRGSGIN